MKIAFFELEDWEKEYFEKQYNGENQTLFFNQQLNQVDFAQISDVEIIASFVFSRIERDMFEKLRQLKFIATMSTGYDHIDLQECKKRNILVSNVPTYGENTVAEHTFMLMLSLTRRLVESRDKVKNGLFSPTGLTGIDLCGKTLGIIGIGNIGKKVCKIAKGFGMNILGFKLNPDPDLERELGIKLVGLDTLIKTSDIITLHVPYTDKTHHMIDATTFSNMKDGVIIINTSRGGLIDTKALIDALDSGKVKGAGLDVLEGEPLLKEEKELLSKKHNQEDLFCVLKNYILFNKPNVIITPHNAFNSKEALERIMQTTDENIQAFMNGSPQNLVYPLQMQYNL